MTFRYSRFEIRLIVETREREKNDATKSLDPRKLNRNFKFLIPSMDLQQQDIPCFVLTKSSDNSVPIKFRYLKFYILLDNQIKPSNNRNFIRNNEGISILRNRHRYQNLLQKQRLFTVKYFHNQKYLSLLLKY